MKKIPYIANYIEKKKISRRSKKTRSAFTMETFTVEASDKDEISLNKTTFITATIEPSDKDEISSMAFLFGK